MEGDQKRKMRMNVGREPCILYETVELLYAYINGTLVTSYTDANPMLSGRVKISSNWTQVYADNLEIRTVKGGIPYATAMIDGQDDGVVYEGAWAINNPGGGSADNWYRTMSEASTAGAAFTFAVDGSGFAIMGSNNGSAVIDVYVDGVMKVENAATKAAHTRGEAYILSDLAAGKHTVKVVVSDGQGGTATRTWTFTRTNSAPTISGSDGNLGDKNLGFTYAYTIDDADGDTLTVVEELNDETIRTINNAPKGEELTVTITSEKLYALGLNSVNTLKITVTDGKGGTAYRRVTFKRTNSAPTISGQDKALGLKNGSFAENYTVSDVEGDNVVVTEFVDDVQIRSYQATLGQQETIELTREKWLSLTNGQHQLRIEAVDGNFATSVRVFSFSKKETVIKFELAAPEETDAAATKVLVTPTWKIEGAVAKVEACNNGFDAVPTWEDITAMVQINRVYNFTNKTKTASKWGVNIRFTITKNEGFEGEVSISGFGGAYE